MSKRGAKVEHSTFVDDVDFSFKTGFSKDKKTIWKSCLFDLPSEDLDEYYAKVYSNTSAKFWSDSFLELEEMISDETNTLKSFRAIEAVLNTNLRGVATKDHTVLRNGFIAYYKGREHIEASMILSILMSQKLPTLERKYCNFQKRKALIGSLILLPKQLMRASVKHMKLMMVFNLKLQMPLKICRKLSLHIKMKTACGI